MKIVLYFFLTLSALGLVLSITSHGAAILGTTGPLGDYSWALHVGIFVVWIPTVLIANRLTKDVPRKDFWKAALRGCPKWMTYMSYGFFGYAFLNFVLFAITAPKGHASNSMSPAVVRGFSGHWMAFYSVALSVLYSATRLWDQEWQSRCQNGHTVSPLAKFCDQCGQPVIEFEDRSQFGR